MRWRGNKDSGCSSGRAKKSRTPFQRKGEWVFFFRGKWKIQSFLKEGSRRPAEDPAQLAFGPRATTATNAAHSQQFVCAREFDLFGPPNRAACDFYIYIFFSDFTKITDVSKICQNYTLVVVPYGSRYPKPAWYGARDLKRHMVRRLRH
jgi:hypothetical protein